MTWGVKLMLWFDGSMARVLDRWCRWHEARAERLAEATEIEIRRRQRER